MRERCGKKKGKNLAWRDFSRVKPVGVELIHFKNGKLHFTYLRETEKDEKTSRMAKLSRDSSITFFS